MNLIKTVLIMVAFFSVVSPAISLAEGTGKERPKLRLCTAQSGNNYYRVGELIADAVMRGIKVRVIETKGSWENLETMSASRPRCDAIVAQDDAVALHRFQNDESKLAMERLTTLFEEKVHLLCNRKVRENNLDEINPGSIAMLINEYGSGSYISWRVMSKLNPKYRRFGASEKALDDALLTLLDNQKPTCLFYVSKLGGKTLNRANQNFGDRLKLLGVKDAKLERFVARLQRKLYTANKIPNAAYPNLIKEDIPTLSVNAVLFISTEWKAQNPKGAKLLSSTLLDLLSKKQPFLH